MLSAAAASGEELTPARQLERASAALDAGRYEAALEDSLSSTQRFRKAGDQRGLCFSLRVVGLAYLYRGDYPAAIASLSEALDLARQTGDFGSEIGRRNDLGSAYSMQGRYQEALEQYELARARVAEVPNDRWSAWGRQLTAANIAILYQTLGDYERALTQYTGLIEGAALGPEERAQLLTNIGVVRRRLGDPVKALETYRQARAIYASGHHLDGEITVANNIGILQSADLGDAKAAEEAFSQAIDLARRGANRPQLAEALLNRGEARFRSGNRSGSRQDFVEALEVARMVETPNTKWRALYGLGRLGSREQLLEAAKLIEQRNKPMGHSEFLAGERALYDLLIETATDLDEIWRWVELGLGAKPVPIAEVRSGLQEDEAILEFWLGARSGVAVWISRQTAGFRHITVPPAMIDDARSAMASPGRTDWRVPATRLAQQLVAGIPVFEDNRVHKLWIVPDGLLLTVPFEALPLESGQLVLQRMEVAYANPLPFRKSGSGGLPQLRLRWPWQRSLAALADPERGSGAGDREWVPLPASRDEAQAIAASIGGSTSVVLGSDAVKPSLVQAAIGYPILHLATHGSSDLTDPERSHLVLAPVNRDRFRYDYLYAKEVRSLGLMKGGLITLSACETNFGKWLPGDGARTLSRDFLEAGAGAVVSTLWSVADRSSSELMKRFYQRLASRESAASALRDAKLDFLQSPESAHPAHWAAFVVQGNGDWYLPALIQWPVILLVVAVTAGAAVSAWRRFRRR